LSKPIRCIPRRKKEGEGKGDSVTLDPFNVLKQIGGKKKRGSHQRKVSLVKELHPCTKRIPGKACFGIREKKSSAHILYKFSETVKKRKRGGRKDSQPQNASDL